MHIRLTSKNYSGKLLFVLMTWAFLQFQSCFALASNTSLPLSAVNNTALNEKLLLLSKNPDPTAQKLLFWLYATQTDLPVNAEKLIGFYENNPHWPRQEFIKRRIEKALFAQHNPDLATTWFSSHAPETREGLYAARKTSAQPDIVNDFWSAGFGNAKDSIKILKDFAPLLKQTAHDNRLENLLSENRLSEAENLLAYVSPTLSQRAHLQIAITRQNKNANTLYINANDQLKRHPDIALQRFRWLRKQEDNDAAIQFLKSTDLLKMNAENWWLDINILARRFIEDKNYNTAFDIVHAMPIDKTKTHWAQVAWMQGWLATKTTPRQYTIAKERFSQLYHSARSSITKSRAAYRLHYIATIENNAAEQDLWLKICRNYAASFYGQACGAIPSQASSVVYEAHITTQQRELINVIELLDNLGLRDLTDPFFAALLQQTKDLSLYVVVAQTAHKVKRLDWAVESNKRAQQNLAAYIPQLGYPSLARRSLPSAPESALIHAIIYRESMFKNDALSPAGALGLMQLMPGTAKQMAQKSKLPYQRARLTTDSNYNITLGAGYLQKMLDRYDGFYPLAIAAYNAGTARVDEWIDTFGDPRNLTSTHDIIDWIEHVPIYETRNYVQRVIETIPVYADHPRALHLLKSK